MVFLQIITNQKVKHQKRKSNEIATNKLVCLQLINHRTPMKNKIICEINTNENSDTYAPKKIIFTYETSSNYSLSVFL